MRQHQHDHCKCRSGLQRTAGLSRPFDGWCPGQRCCRHCTGASKPPGPLSSNRLQGSTAALCKQTKHAGRQHSGAVALRGRGPTLQCQHACKCLQACPQPSRTQEGNARSACRGLLSRRWLRRCGRGLPVRGCTALRGGALQRGAAAAAGKAVCAQGEAAAGARCAVLHRIHRLQSLQRHAQRCRTRHLVPPEPRGRARQRRHAAQAHALVSRAGGRSVVAAMYTAWIRLVFKAGCATVAGTWGSMAPAAVSAQMRLASGAARCTLAPADAIRPRKPLRCSLAATPWPMHALRPTSRLNEGMRAPGDCSLGGAWHGQEWAAKAELAGQP